MYSTNPKKGKREGMGRRSSGEQEGTQLDISEEFTTNSKLHGFFLGGGVFGGMCILTPNIQFGGLVL